MLQAKIGTPFYNILPYMELKNLDFGNDVRYDINGNMYAKSSDGTTLTNWPLFRYVINAYRCPDEPSPSVNTGMGGSTLGCKISFGISNYAGNYLVFGNPIYPYNLDGAFGTPEGRTRLADIRDGQSNTIFFTERYGSCNSVPGSDQNSSSTLSCLWAGSSGSSYWPQFCGLGGTPGTDKWPLCQMFQVCPTGFRGMRSHQGPIAAHRRDTCLHG